MQRFAEVQRKGHAAVGTRAALPPIRIGIVISAAIGWLFATELLAANNLRGPLILRKNSSGKQSQALYISLQSNRERGLRYESQDRIRGFARHPHYPILPEGPNSFDWRNGY